MSKKQEQIVEQNAEQEEKEVTKENTVIEAPESITGEVPAEDKQEETEVKYKAKACIYYGNKKIMPGEILLNVETNTIHSLLKNGFIELV
ncbi:MAG TPA: hypothetical protein H9804_03830 [Candidatus Mucispirillum faecigallinarum]|uniref:Uncharacterized protein n=1 Tax=Candidatus Mucispirillum faecigallinarum TaxID=2838699 RepID=A0A9D2GU66_9BACT|nr:hypothetical protein [Candidatus Mucispirillum faecigallinarum]